MIMMFMVAGGLGLIVGAMLFYDSLERKRKERYQADITGNKSKDLHDRPAKSATERDLEPFREELKIFERRLYLKLAIICAFAIAVSVLLLRYCR